MAVSGRSLVRILTVATATAGTSMLFAVPVQAQEAPPGSAGSAVDQYVEQVPTASGPSAPGVTKATRSPLPRAGAKALRQARPGTADALEEIATSSDYGAPNVTQRTTQKPGAGRTGRAPEPVTTASASATLRSSVGALGTASDTRLIVLLVVLLVSVLAAAAIALRRT